MMFVDVFKHQQRNHLDDSDVVSAKNALKKNATQLVTSSDEERIS